ncbi:hypothetical protein BT69DRAFT_1338410 [Atractiella rhizophila]|nr:hypothetical protein BT69DRAFT_1338410 [Atractiella rhizophila]
MADNVNVARVKRKAAELQRKNFLKSDVMPKSRRQAPSDDDDAAPPTTSKKRTLSARQKQEATQPVAEKKKRARRNVPANTASARQDNTSHQPLPLLSQSHQVLDQTSNSQFTSATPVHVRQNYLKSTVVPMAEDSEEDRDSEEELEGASESLIRPLGEDEDDQVDEEQDNNEHMLTAAQKEVVRDIMRSGRTASGTTALRMVHTSLIDPSLEPSPPSIPTRGTPHRTSSGSRSLAPVVFAHASGSATSARFTSFQPTSLDKLRTRGAHSSSHLLMEPETIMSGADTGRGHGGEDLTDDLQDVKLIVKKKLDWSSPTKDRTAAEYAKVEQLRDLLTINAYPSMEEEKGIAASRYLDASGGLSASNQVLNNITSHQATHRSYFARRARNGLLKLYDIPQDDAEEALYQLHFWAQYFHYADGNPLVGPSTGPATVPRKGWRHPGFLSLVKDQLEQREYARATAQWDEFQAAIPRGFLALMATAVTYAFDYHIKYFESKRDKNDLPIPSKFQFSAEPLKAPYVGRYRSFMAELSDIPDNFFVKVNKLIGRQVGLINTASQRGTMQTADDTYQLPPRFVYVPDDEEDMDM